MAPSAMPEKRDRYFQDFPSRAGGPAPAPQDRCQTRSLVLTSQMPVAKWHQQIGDSTIAEGILDRIVHRAHRIELRGESMRKNPPKQQPQPER